MIAKTHSSSRIICQDRTTLKALMQLCLSMKNLDGDKNIHDIIDEQLCFTEIYTVCTTNPLEALVYRLNLTLSQRDNIYITQALLLALLHKLSCGPNRQGGGSMLLW